VVSATRETTEHPGGRRGSARSGGSVAARYVRNDARLPAAVQFAHVGGERLALLIVAWLALAIARICEQQELSDHLRWRYLPDAYVTRHGVEVLVVGMACRM
jgi:hypothetical protein